MRVKAEQPKVWVQYRYLGSRRRPLCTSLGVEVVLLPWLVVSTYWVSEQRGFEGRMLHLKLKI